MLEGIMLGDPHFDKLTGIVPNALELQAGAYRNAFEWALKRGIGYAFIGGDVANSHRLSEEAKIELMRLLLDYGDKLCIRIILGNHDVKTEEKHSLHLFSWLAKKGKLNVGIYEKPEQEILAGVPVNFMPFPYSAPLPNECQCVNVGHLERPGSIRDNGTRNDKHGVKDTKNLWMMGHLHTAQTVGKTYYCGTLYQTNFGESLPKGFTHFKFKRDGKKLKHKMDWIETKPPFVLEKKVVEKKADFKGLVKDPLHIYKLFVNEGLDIPNLDGVTVHELHSFGSKIELQEIEKASDNPFAFDLTTNLEEWLLDNKAPELVLQSFKKVVKRGIKELR